MEDNLFQRRVPKYEVERKVGKMDEKIKTTIENLKKHGFKAMYVENRDAAKDAILNIAAGCKTVGVGGTSTVRDTGVLEALKEKGFEVWDHWATDNMLESLQIRKKQVTADLFLTGSNAVTMTGELVNREGVGNRINAMTFGPGKVVVVVGINKIVPDIPSAMERIKKVAAPIRAKQLNVKTPCVKTGVCEDCNSAQRICRVTIIHERRPSLTDMTVIIVGEEMGN